MVELRRSLPALLVILGMSVWSDRAEAVAGLAKGDRLAQATNNGCPTPAVLSRLKRHKVAPGETLDSIARKHNLIPATLMGMNPATRNGKVAVGSELLVPPFNGIRVELQPNQTIRDLAKVYRVRPDVLFEVNGCQQNPKVAFVPGVNWSPVPKPVEGNAANVIPGQSSMAYPLPSKLTQSSVLLSYGWGILPGAVDVAFHSGVDLAAKVNTPVLAVADGTIAFAGDQGSYGKLIVINHAAGMQTRYAQLNSIKVTMGQTVKRGEPIAIVGTSGRPSVKESHLHFEVRSRTELGWVAEDPELYLMR